MSKAVTTLRLPENKLNLIRGIAGYENRSLATIYAELTDEYIDRHRETMALLSIPNFLEECLSGVEEIKSGKGISLSELED